jgi:hypothetical protein
MPASSIYKDRILAGRKFRLLSIYPAIDKDRPLECSCNTFELDKAPPYEAVSYVWGDPTACTEILCNGQPITIQLELAKALFRLRLRNTIRIVWADAICIHQVDNAEKSYQVPLMGSIYSAAKRVVVWLGYGDQWPTGTAFECAEVIARACRKFDSEHGLDDDERHVALRLPQEMFPATVCDSLRVLFSRPWFTRIWCVQEIRLAQDALVLWGDSNITWADLSLAASWVFDKTVPLDQSDPVAPLLVNIKAEYADIMRDKDRTPLLTTLQNFREFRSTDPRDKVYGLLNLISPSSEVDALRVDYNLSVAQVYADTVLTDMRLYSRLTALAYITHPENYDGEDDYRSWAPRWDDMNVTRLLGLHADECPWNPCDNLGGSKTGKGHLTSGHIRLKGMIYDTVRDVEMTMDCDSLLGATQSHSTITGTGDSSDELPPFIKVLTTLCPGFPEQIQENERESIHTLARTITAGTSNILDPIYIEYMDISAQTRFYAAFEHSMARMMKLHRIGTLRRYPHTADSVRFEADVADTCSLRRIFWTKNGSFGLGPQCMRPGDVVVVLYGGNTPYVLRQKGENWLFVGQAYVDEIMHGELMKNLRTGRAKEQKFCLL